MFIDRQDAGRQLGKALKRQGLGGAECLVLAIPRGGVQVGLEVARILSCDLDAVMAKKIPAPHNPEVAVAAVTCDGTLVVRPDLAGPYLPTREYLEKEGQLRARSIARRLQVYRGNRPEVDCAGRTVILVDDGIATGFTVLAALRSLRNKGPRQLVLAIPTAPQETIAALTKEVEHVVCLCQPEPFFAVGQAYRDFAPVDESWVVAALAQGNDRSI
jgi:putative phosphoribosyl transferase